jgi:hypothetical protein
LRKISRSITPGTGKERPMYNKWSPEPQKTAFSYPPAKRTGMGAKTGFKAHPELRNSLKLTRAKIRSSTTTYIKYSKSNYSSKRRGWSRYTRRALISPNRVKERPCCSHRSLARKSSRAIQLQHIVQIARQGIHLTSLASSGEGSWKTRLT